MRPDDPRHGTPRGFYAGCREECCRKAYARYEKKRRLDRLSGGRAVPALGAQRRIQALMRLGWTSVDIAEAAGWPERNYVLRILHGQKGKPARWLERKTHEAICDVYERLSMRLPEPSRYANRSRLMAERRGWAPPLAWDDIDNDPAPYRPTVRRDTRTKHDVDEAVVLRVMAGERLAMTTAERREVVRRLLARGWSYVQIEEQTGIKKVERHIERPREEEAA